MKDPILLTRKQNSQTECPTCGSWYLDFLKECPNCGTENEEPRDNDYTRTNKRKKKRKEEGYEMF